MKMNSDNPVRRQSPANRRPSMVLVGVGVLSFVVVVLLSHWIDAHRPAADTRVEEERLYVTGKVLKRVSLGFNGLVADWYWMRSLQYVGRKILANPGTIDLDNLGKLDMRLLYPLLDTATTIDPQFLVAYKYGAIVLPAVNEEDAIKLILKGIDQNPNDWRLHQHLGYIYWKRGDYQKASEVYGAGAKKPGAPPWMEEMSARTAAEGGSHATAREIYRRMYEQTEDKTVKDLMARRLLQVDSFEERDAIRGALKKFRDAKGNCPKEWKEALAELRAARQVDGKPLRLDNSGVPIDPSDWPYVLSKDGCDVSVNLQSKVPFQ